MGLLKNLFGKNDGGEKINRHLCQRCGKTMLTRAEFTSEISKMGLKLDSKGNITASGAFGSSESVQSMQTKVASMEGQRAIRCKSCGKEHCLDCLSKYAPNHPSTGGKACLSCKGALQEI